MITLIKDGREIQVRTEVQASAFLMSGWERGSNEEVQEDSKENYEDNHEEDENQNIFNGDQNDNTRAINEVKRMNSSALREKAAELDIELSESETNESMKEKIISVLKEA